MRRKVKVSEEDWAGVRYLVFDAPAAKGPFEDRLVALRAALGLGRGEGEGEGEGTVAAVAQERCEGGAHLDRLLEAMLASGGEGLMLRAPGSAYKPGKRTRDLLKVKRFHDAEATVIEHVPGKGKHKGRLGALRVKCPATGVEFKVGTGFSDAQRQDPPPVGAAVTYKYQEKTRAGAPRFPVFVRVRPLLD